MRSNAQVVSSKHRSYFTMADLILSPDEVDEIAEDDPLFGELIDSSLEDVKGMVRDVISSTPRVEDAVGAGASIAEMLQEGDQYVAKIPDEVKQGLASGDLERMKKGATNLWNGTIRKASGNKAIEAQANFEKVELTPERLQGLQSLALQAQIRRMSEKLEELSDKIDTVLEGQHSDRVAQVQAGMNQYRTSQEYENTDVGQLELTNAQQSLEEGRMKLRRWLEETVQPPRPPEGLREQLWSFIGVTPRDERMRQLEQNKEKVAEALQFYLRASAYLLKIQLIRDELGAANQLINEHTRAVGRINDRLMREKIPLPPEIRKFGRELGDVKEQLERIQSEPLELTFSREHLLS